MRRLIVGLAVVAIAVAAPTDAAKKKYTHENYFEHYEGTKTCLKCHEDESVSFQVSHFSTFRVFVSGFSPGESDLDGDGVDGQ